MSTFFISAISIPINHSTNQPVNTHRHFVLKSSDVLVNLAIGRIFDDATRLIVNRSVNKKCLR